MSMSNAGHPSEIMHAFRSARLCYLRADETNVAFSAILSEVTQDPVTQTVASLVRLQPWRQKDLDEIAEHIARSLLAVTICLAPEEATARGLQTQCAAEQAHGWGISAAVEHNRTAALDIRLATKYQSMGYGREAVNWMLDWAFRRAALHTVSMSVTSINVRGRRLAEALGFRSEGCKKEAIWLDRAWYDALAYGMTECEWEELRRSQDRKR
ncbi:GCN5-related N-acetyltransferase (GNAT) domain-containingprotein [Purpureocillium lavendulum]|uniref:GCN5-related N-acetyltransferase (GNAT) domain-containingprotein n=1 Tax=Purpureocillium lavendulum TaxID=1247861 RepID=A0AB34FEP7_9HYPO|nr:GCN5-related N-acetyltransferase (GNAT) domain-containingprotein [Purpureocillium lavendulum]